MIFNTHSLKHGTDWSGMEGLCLILGFISHTCKYSSIHCMLLYIHVCDIHCMLLYIHVCEKKYLIHYNIYLDYNA